MRDAHLIRPAFNKQRDSVFHFLLSHVKKRKDKMSFVLKDINFLIYISEGSYACSKLRIMEVLSKKEKPKFTHNGFLYVFDKLTADGSRKNVAMRAETSWMQG